ncbi:hypothetical protein QBC35DRAFT_510668 [Podospora australis]|uniref:BTB domain-containing protein n=1 Tax=Podospora australis TaxID=1536484 RepID=A0AAN6WHQ5_9PEZI|nr:hypothetical protein QBC35DRAFT_510668 [Podospora australis]
MDGEYEDMKNFHGEYEDTEIPNDIRPVRFQVSSSTLRRHSPVWNAMLFGPWLESKSSATSGHWTVPLPEDKPEAFRLAMNIIHGNFKAVPKTLELHEFSHLLTLLDKYDSTHIIRPWLYEWFSVLPGWQKTNPEREAAIYIDWKLGNEKSFFYKLRDIGLSMSLDPQSGNPLYAGQPFVIPSEHHYGSTDILNRILEYRTS